MEYNRHYVMTTNLYVRLQHCNEKNQVTFPSHIFPFNVPNRPTFRNNAMRKYITHMRHISQDSAVASADDGATHVEMSNRCKSKTKMWPVFPKENKSSFKVGNYGRVRLALSRLAGWPANSRNHCSYPIRTVFFSHNN